MSQNTLHGPIYVGPDSAHELVSAVTAGGGRTTDRAEEAVGMVWFGGTPADFGRAVHPGIRWVQLPAAGIESWFEAGAISTDRVFTSAAGCYAATVAEHSLGMMLALARELPQLARATTWTRPQPTALSGSTVAIVGAGGIGQAIIRLLEPFQTRVLAVTRSGRDVPGASRSAGPGELHTVLAEADHVVIAAPATARTRHLIGAEELAVMHSHSLLVNVARGSLIDTDALVDALASGQIRGAALDVTDPEPLPDGHPLWSEPRALITPHSSNPRNLLLDALAQRVRKNTAAFLADGPMEGVVQVENGY
jgi:phosphoglycerate dehydrogenase-like enzyme